MTEEPDGLPQRSDYVTDARIIVKRGMQAEPPESGWLIIADTDVGASEVHRQVAGIAFDRELQITNPYVARSTYLDYEWGGSAAHVEVVLHIASIVSEEAVGAAVGLALEQIVKRVTERHRRRSQQPLTVADADVQARAAIKAIYERDGTKLKLVGEAHAEDSITLTYRHRTRETFTARVEPYKRGAQVTHVTRSSHGH